MEPCSFHGRTPSCAEAIGASGIRRVVVALLDPDERNNGAGIEILRRAGIEVTLGVLADAALQDLGPYLALDANQSLQPQALLNFIVSWLKFRVVR